MLHQYPLPFQAPTWTPSIIYGTLGPNDTYTQRNIVIKYQFNSGENEYYKEGYNMDLQHNRNLSEITHSLVPNKTIRHNYHSHFEPT